MGSIRTVESIAKLVKTSVTTLSLPASRLNIGAKQYVTSALTLNTAVSGVGGLDATIVAGSLYYVYAVVSSGNVYLIGSTNSSLPSPFTQARVVGGFTTNASSQIDQVGEYPGNLAVAGSVSAGGGLISENTSNFAINGGFDFWQRGPSLTAGNGLRYLSDRFLTMGTGSTVAPSRVSLPAGSFAGQSTYYYHRCVVASSAGAGNLALLGHRVENVWLLSGKTITISFWAKADANKNIALEIARFYGTGGSPSSEDTGLSITTLALTTSWTKYSVTLSVPSLSGKTVGTDGPHTSYMQFLFWMDAGSGLNVRTNSLGQQSGTFDFAEVMINIGNTAAPFQRAGGTVGGELALCQRYYEKSFNTGVTPGASDPGTPFLPGITWSNNQTYINVPYKVTKRIAALTQTYNGSGTAGLVSWQRNGVSQSEFTYTHSAAYAGENSFVVTITGAAAGDRIEAYMHWTADAEL